MKKFTMFFLLLFTLPFSAAAVIFEPIDRLETFSEIVMLRGRSDSPDRLEINGKALKISSDGTFSCGLVLNPGKNLVEVRQGERRQNIRILRLITFPDTEILYDGKKHWARGQIVYLATLGIIEGEPDGNFYPGRPVTRGEFATWLARSQGLSLPTLTEDVYFDVPKEHWRAPYVKAVVDAGYMAPCSKEVFGIEDPISRREAAEIATRAEGEGIVGKASFFYQDVPPEVGNSASNNVAQKRKLIAGVPEKASIYDPERALTRAEAAVLFSEFKKVQMMVADLSNFEVGYRPAKFCTLNVSPEIVSFFIIPSQVQLKKPSSVKLRAKIASRAGFVPISKVKVDLSQIGGPAGVEMFDNGTMGDEKAGDSIYSLNITFTPEFSGERILRVTAIDRLGWQGEKESSISISE